jgi:hypothetical protein
VSIPSTLLIRYRRLSSLTFSQAAFGRFFHLKGNPMHERAHLETVLNGLDATPRALRRDACGDWHIKGKHGHILADGSGYLIVVETDESSRRWNNVKQRLSFCRVAQDGDDKGCLHLDRLPTAAEAELIRDAIRVKRKRHLSPEALEQATLALARARAAQEGPQWGISFA